MKSLTTAGLVCLVGFLPLTVAAVSDPRLARDASPEVVVCCISDVVSEEGDERSAYSARCAVQKVVRATAEIAPGDVLTIAYEIIHAVFEKPQPAMPGPAFPTPPPPLHDGDFVTAYLHSAKNFAGESIFVPHIGIDSFEPVSREGHAVPAACAAPEGGASVSDLRSGLHFDSRLMNFIREV